MIATAAAPKLSVADTLRRVASSMTPSMTPPRDADRNFNVRRLYLHLEGPTSGYCRHEYGRAAYAFADKPEARSIEEAAALLARYRRFCEWMREGRHDWTPEREIHYADNSTAVVERSALTGETRQRMTTPPSGDVCY